jgi:hypothetical protein
VREQWYGLFKVEGWRPGLADDEVSTRQLIGRYVDRYNGERLHSAIGYVTPADKLAGREAEIFAAQDRKLEAARQRRAEERTAARSETQVPV